MDSHLIGTVADTRKNYVGISTATGNMYHCTYDIFCPMQIGDVFSGSVQVLDAQHRKVQLNKSPKIIFPIDDQSIVVCLDKRRGPKLSTEQSKNTWKILDALTTLAPSEVEREDLLCLYADRWRRKLSTGSNIEAYFSNAERLKWGSWWHKNRTMRALHLLGFNNKDVRECYLTPRELYKRTIANPYRVPIISLAKCGQLCEQLELNPTELDIYCGRIVRALYANMKDRSWTCTPMKKMMITYEGIDKMLDYLRIGYGVELYNHHLYLENANDSEAHISDWIKTTKDSSPVKVEFTDDLDLVQQEAVRLALSSRLSIITGGPGTGKTTIIKEILRNLEVMKIDCDIVSYTGKAVARVREVTNYGRSYTLHQLIATSSEGRNVNHLLIDEASMIPLELFSKFIRQFNPKSVTFIGDPHQLEPISWGSLFSQLIKADVIPKVVLQKVYRTNAPALLNNLKAIRDHEPEIHYEQGDGFIALPGGISEVKAIVEMFKGQGVPSSSISVITPYNKDVSILNAICQELSTPGRTSITDDKKVMFREGDRVMLTENRYDINVMNGEEGTISLIIPGALEVDFGRGKKHIFPTVASSNKVTGYDKPGEGIDQEPLSTALLILSYSITVHKSQGSEYEIVIFYIPKSGANRTFLTRNLAYTALSRAKQSVFLVGSTSDGETAAVTSAQHRNEQLAHRLTHN